MKQTCVGDSRGRGGAEWGNLRDDDCKTLPRDPAHAAPLHQTVRAAAAATGLAPWRRYQRLRLRASVGATAAATDPWRRAAALQRPPAVGGAGERGCGAACLAASGGSGAGQLRRPARLRTGSATAHVTAGTVRFCDATPSRGAAVAAQRRPGETRRALPRRRRRRQQPWPHGRRPVTTNRLSRELETRGASAPTASALRSPGFPSRSANVSRAAMGVPDGGGMGRNVAQFERAAGGERCSKQCQAARCVSNGLRCAGRLLRPVRSGVCHHTGKEPPNCRQFV